MHPIFVSQFSIIPLHTMHVRWWIYACACTQVHVYLKSMYARRWVWLGIHAKKGTCVRNTCTCIHAQGYASEKVGTCFVSVRTTCTWVFMHKGMHARRYACGMHVSIQAPRHMYIWEKNSTEPSVPLFFRMILIQSMVFLSNICAHTASAVELSLYFLDLHLSIVWSVDFYCIDRQRMFVKVQAKISGCEQGYVSS